MPHILIIEDDELIRSLLADVLAAEGYQVSGSEPAASAPDLVIVDVYMPRRLDADRLRAVRTKYPGVPLVAISGQFRPGTCCAGSSAESLGVDRLIAIPFDRAVLLDAVRSLLGARALKEAR